jgi:hypothetical protein
MALPIRRPGGGSTGGGFLHNQTGKINAGSFRVDKKGNRKDGSPWTKYSIVLNVTPDGGKASDQYFPAGFLPDGLSISPDGKQILGDAEYTFDDTQAWGKFLLSLFTTAENHLDDANVDLRKLDFVTNLRATFERQYDREATIAAGIRKLKLTEAAAKTTPEAQLLEAGKREGKAGTKAAGKKFMLDNLLVKAVVGIEAPATTAKKTTTRAAKPAAAAAAAPTTPAASADVTQADGALIAVLTASGGQIERTKFSPAFLRYAKAMPMDQREPLRKLLVSDEYVTDAAKRGVIVLDGTGKTATMILNPDFEAASAQ